ncbi:MAG: substrate-binding domain-containing protein [Verrucomicrobiia bacterium]
MIRRKPATTRGRRTRVALLIETSNAYARELLHGIRTYARENPHWALHLTEQGRGETPPAWLRSWRGDGMIARVETQSVADVVRQAAVPVVNVSAAEFAPECPTVISDSSAIARLAAEHLLERGFRHFGYCGDGRFAWSARHGAHFVQHLTDAGFECAVFDSRPADTEDWEREQGKLAQWIRSLPKPAGVMACYDIRGQQVLDVCRAAGVAVPDDVAVIGQHNDELLCDLCDPPLSSVVPNARRAGYEAAALLDRMMRGKAKPPQVLLIEPVGVVTRQSTDVLAVSDPQLSAAVRFIREHACEHIGVEDARKVAALSRTLFERRFRRVLGCAPYEQILRVRLAKARELLALTNLTLAEISERTGFSSPEYLQCRPAQTPQGHAQ